MMDTLWIIFIGIFIFGSCSSKCPLLVVMIVSSFSRGKFARKHHKNVDIGSHCVSFIRTKSS